MPHASPGVTSMQHPAKGLGQSIGGIEKAGKVFHDDVTFLAPFLNGKVLRLDMASLRRGPVLAGHLKGREVVDEQLGWTSA